MKKIVLFLSFFLLVMSYFGYKYFKSTNLEFDSVYHYVIADDNLPVQTLTHNISDLEYSIIYDEYPYNLNFKFNEELTKIGFKKTEIENTKFSKLKEISSSSNIHWNLRRILERNSSGFWILRDILVGCDILY